MIMYTSDHSLGQGEQAGTGQRGLNNFRVLVKQTCGHHGTIGETTVD